MDQRLDRIRTDAAQHLQTDDDVTYLLGLLDQVTAENRDYERALGLNDSP
ncbi:hypothetical protein [Streptomyces sp. NPDC093589]